MLSEKDFVFGENETQEYYYFKNDINGDNINIVKNKGQFHWMGFLSNKDSVFIIPIEFSTDVNKFVKDICNWYNDGKKVGERSCPPEISTKKYNKTLNNITNIFGGFNEESALRIQSYLNDPIIDRWDDISSILIRNSITVWQAVLLLDEEFPRQGRSYNIKNEILKEWERIPEPLLVQRAIKKVLDEVEIKSYF